MWGVVSAACFVLCQYRRRPHHISYCMWGVISTAFFPILTALINYRMGLQLELICHTPFHAAGAMPDCPDWAKPSRRWVQALLGTFRFFAFFPGEMVPQIILLTGMKPAQKVCVCVGVCVCDDIFQWPGQIC